MGEIAEAMLDGTLCQYCGVYLENSHGPFPQSCPDCAEQEKEARKQQKKSRK